MTSLRNCMLLLSCFSFLSMDHRGSSCFVMAQQVELHGSGSSATRRCFWHVMETLSGQTKISTRSTYRSTGSGTGLSEFLGNISHPYNDFGSADFPLPKENYDALANAGVEMIHLPVVMGAVSIFHSLPLGKTQDSAGPTSNILNLTSCLIARIYKGEIDDWTHPDILEINPGFEIPEQLDLYGNPIEDPSFSIMVAHRSGDSGTTNTFTSYLHKVCPEHWGEELFGSEIEWPMTGSDRLVTTSGTSDMISALLTEEWVIGYSDVGSALDEGLDEAALKVEGDALKDDFFLTASNALSKDGVAAALEAEGTQIPESGDVDWSGVDTVNQVEGYIYAWPMTALTYAYVRKDLTTMPDPRAQSFLKAFLRAMYDDEYVGKCEKEFGFLAIKDGLRDLALQSIEMLRTSPGAPEWTQETSVLPDGEGQGEYVISTRRGVSSVNELEILKEKALRTETTLQETIQSFVEIQTEFEGVAGDLDLATIELENAKSEIFQDWSKRIDSSFIMAIVALSISFLLAVLVLFRQERRLRKLESLPAPMLQKQVEKKRRSDRVEQA